MNVEEMTHEELNVAVAIEVMEWVVNGDAYVTEAITMTEAWQLIPNFSTDIAAAVPIVEVMRKRGYHINIIPQEDGYLITVAEFQSQLNVYHNIVDLRIDTFDELPGGISRAALLARRGDD